MGSLPEPTWNNPTQTWTDDSALDSMPLSGSLVSGLLLRLLESHFFSADNIVDPQLKTYLWKENTPAAAAITTKILIKLAEDYDVRNLEQRPAILVKRNEITSRRISLAGKTLTHLESNGNYRGEEYSRLIEGSHIILCIAEGGFATDKLAEEVFYRLLRYGPSIKNDLRFGDFEISGYTPSEPFKEAGERQFLVRVGIKWSSLYLWDLLPVAPVLKKVRTTAPDIF